MTESRKREENKPGGGLRKIAQGIMLLIVLSLVCFIIGKGTAAMLDEKVRASLDEAGARYGIRIAAEDVSFVSWNGVTIGALAVSLPEAPPFLVIDEAVIRVHPIDWALGRPFVSGADLVHPQLTLRRDSGGIWEVTRIRRRAAAAGTGGGSSLRERIEVDLSDLEITITTPSDNVSRLYREAAVALDRSTGRVEGRLADVDESFAVDLRRGADLRCRFDLQRWSPTLLAPFVGRIIDLAAARLTLTGEAVRSETGAIDAAIRGRIENVTIDYALLSRERTDGIGFGFAIDLHGVNQTWLLRRGDVELGGETVSVTGTLATDPEAGRIVNLRAGFDRLDLGRVVAGIPRSLTPRLPDLAAEGRLDGVFSLSYESARPTSLDYSFDGAVESFAITNLSPEIDLARLEKTFTHVVTAPGGESRVLVVGPEGPDFVSYGRVPQALIGAILTAEDGSFFSHKGFSPRHIHEAIIANLQAGRVVRGASTITMQLAKNLFLSRERTLSRKIEETFLTMALEQSVPKKRLFEIYLNIIEWGPGVYGIGPAARHYFGRAPSALSPLQCAFLASIIARPGRGWGHDPLARIGDGWKSYLHIILTKMYRRGDVTIEDLVEAGVSDTTIRTLSGAVDETLPPPPSFNFAYPS